MSIVLFKRILLPHVQVGIAEAVRQQPARRHFHDIVFQVRQDHRQVGAAHLEDHLAAGAAWRDRFRRIARDSQPGEVAWFTAMRDGAENAVRSAQLHRPYAAFSTLQPRKTRPSLHSSAAPTLKREYGAYASSRPALASAISSWLFIFSAIPLKSLRPGSDPQHR